MNSFELDFRSVNLEDHERIYPYTSRYGEGSCQHSPVSMYSLAEKYHDEVCISNGFLFTRRSGLCDNEYNVYLAPLGEVGSGSEGIRKAYEAIFADAAAQGKKVKFLTLTESAAKNLEECFPGRFEVTEDRDLSEYFYLTKTMAGFEGSELRKRRAEVHTFWNQFGNRAQISYIGSEDIPKCLEYEKKWIAENKETHDAAALERDERVIGLQMAHFDELLLSGIILKVDGNMCGFCYGTKLGDTYDVIVEKADRSVPHSYKVLRQESAKRCAGDCTYINMEEDLGIPGLRALKLAYKPEFLLKKYIVTEK